MWHDGSGEVVDLVNLSGGQELGDKGTIELRLSGLGGNVHRPHPLGLPCRMRSIRSEGMQHAYPELRVGVGIGRHTDRHGHAVDVNKSVDDAVAVLVVQQGIQSLGHAEIAAANVRKAQTKEGHGVGIEGFNRLNESLNMRGVVLQPVATRKGDPNGGPIGV